MLPAGLPVGVMVPCKTATPGLQQHLLREEAFGSLQSLFLVPGLGGEWKPVCGLQSLGRKTSWMQGTSPLWLITGLQGF